MKNSLFALISSIQIAQLVFFVPTIGNAQMISVADPDEAQARQEIDREYDQEYGAFIEQVQAISADRSDSELRALYPAGMISEDISVKDSLNELNTPSAREAGRRAIEAGIANAGSAKAYLAQVKSGGFGHFVCKAGQVVGFGAMVVGMLTLLGSIALASEEKHYNGLITKADRTFYTHVDVGSGLGILLGGLLVGRDCN